MAGESCLGCARTVRFLKAWFGRRGMLSCDGERQGQAGMVVKGLARYVGVRLGKAVEAGLVEIGSGTMW